MADDVLGETDGGKARGLEAPSSDLDIMGDLLDGEAPEDGGEVKEEEPEEPEQEETPESEEEEPEQEEEEEEDEQEEQEEGSEEEAESSLDLHGKEIVAKITKLAPDLLKKVPELRAVIFKEHEYAKSFASPQDAKEGVERLAVMDRFENSIMAGDPTLTLATLAQSDIGTYNKYIANLLPTLHKHDKEGYLKITTPLIKNLFRSVLADGVDSKNENQIKAVKILSKKIFGSYEIPEDVKTGGENDAQKEFDKKVADFEERKQTEFTTNTQLSGIKRIRTEIEKRIEPLRLSSFVKDALIERVIKETNIALGKDSVHTARINSLWSKAAKTLSENDRTMIISAYLGGARMVMPKVLQSKLKELNTPGRKLGASSDDTPAKKFFKKKQESRRPSSNGNQPKGSGKAGFYRANSDMDILNGKVK